MTDYYPYILSASPIIMNGLHLVLRGEFSLDKFKIENAFLIASIFTPLLLLLLYQITKLLEPFFLNLKSFLPKEHTIYIRDKQLMRKIINFMNINKKSNYDIIISNGKIVKEPHFHIEKIYDQDFKPTWISYPFLNDVVHIAAYHPANPNKQTCIIMPDNSRDIAFMIKGKEKTINRFTNSLFYDIKITKDIIAKMMIPSVYGSGVQYIWTSIEENKTKFSDCILPKKMEEQLDVLIKNFMCEKQRQQLKELNLKNRLTLLFHGVAGCGKTTVAMGIANKLNRDIYFYPKNEYLFDISEIPLSNCVLMFDDVDFLNLEQRITHEEQKFLSNDKLIKLMELLDGYTVKDDNIVIILITNFKEKLDNALTRNGRIDVDIQFNGMNEIEMYDKIWNRFYKKRLILTEEETEKLLKANFSVSKIWSEVVYPNKFNEENARNGLLRLI